MTATAANRGAHAAPRIRRPAAALAWLVVLLMGSVGGAVRAGADTDDEFAARMHAQGLYGPPDQQAWLAKITCKRLDTGLDRNAFTAARFLSGNFPRATSIAQTWQFLAAAIDTYCPDQQAVLAAAAAAAP